jgi:hypothetical protein
MIIPISNNILDKFTLINHEYLVNREFYDNNSGSQEYRLYSYLSTFFDNITILDIGTLDGRSAVALSHNENNTVISYNITDQINNKKHHIYTKKNITFNIKNVLDDLNLEFIKNVKIVMIDIDHFGQNELVIINKLRELKFSGMIILDDITNHPDAHINMCMNELWNNITEIKYDFTKYAHWSGTGIVIINDDISFQFE